MHLAYVDGRIENYRSVFLSNLENQFSQLSLISEFCGDDIDNGNIYTLHERKLAFGSKKIVYFSRVISNLRKIRPDAVFSGDMGLRTLMCVLYCKLNGISVYPWARLTTWSERNAGLIRKLIRRVIISNSTGVIVNSEDGADYIQSLKHCKTYILYQSSSHSVLARTLRQLDYSHRGNWIYVGRIIEAKGLKAFFETLASVDVELRRNLSFDFVGDGDLREWLKNFLELNEINHKFHGNLSGTQVIRALDDASFFLFPSLCDEWGLVVIEAMNRGIPILGSLKSGAIAELKDKGNFGVFFDPGNLEHMKSSIEKAIRIDASEYSRLAFGSWQISKAMNLQPDKMSERLYEIIYHSRDFNN